MVLILYKLDPFFVLGTGTSSFMVCPAGTYSLIGASACTLCFAGYFSSPASASCDGTCPAGTYALAGNDQW